MECVDERQCAHGGVDLAYATAGDDKFMRPEVAAVIFKTVDIYCRMVGDKRQQQCQLLVHGCNYGDFHISIFLISTFLMCQGFCDGSGDCDRDLERRCDSRARTRRAIVIEDILQIPGPYIDAACLAGSDVDRRVDSARVKHAVVEIVIYQSDAQRYDVTVCIICDEEALAP